MEVVTVGVVEEDGRHAAAGQGKGGDVAEGEVEGEGDEVDELGGEGGEGGGGRHGRGKSASQVQRGFGREVPPPSPPAPAPTLITFFWEVANAKLP